MITDDDLRALLGSDEVPPSLSPSAVRHRARQIRRGRRLGAAVVTAMVVPLVALVTVGLPGTATQPIDGTAGTPPAFDGYGHALPQLADGKVKLGVPHLFAYTGPGDLCWGSDDQSISGQCMVAGTNDYGWGTSTDGGVIGGITTKPVARAEFILGTTVEPATVVGFAKYPTWRVLTAPWTGSEADGSFVLTRGWDAAGKLILSEGCVGGCPMPTLSSQPTVAATAPAPAASSAPAAPPRTALPDARVAVIDGVQAWPTAHGVCVGDQSQTQCATDGDTAIDDGFALGKGVAVTIIGKPMARAEFLVGSTPVPATVLGFSGHPQWRVVAANLKLPNSTGKPVSLRGWDANGTLIVALDPTK